MNIATASTVSGHTGALDLSWTITAAIAIMSLISPIFVALINNEHIRKIKKLDIAHAERLRKMDNDLSISKEYLDVYFRDKKQALLNLIKCANYFSVHSEYNDPYFELHTAAEQAMLFCNEATNLILREFLLYVDREVYGQSLDSYELEVYNKELSKIVSVIYDEFKSSNPLIDTKQCK